MHDGPIFHTGSNMDFTFLQISFLAVIQGIAEFLPISSSGHIVIVSSLLGGGNGEAIDAADINIVLHVGTLGSIIVVYFERIMKLLKEDRRLIGLLMVATVPTVIVGLPLQLYFKDILSSPLLAGVLLIGTGSLLLFGSRYNQAHQGTGRSCEITVPRALAIGCSQALAVLPGLSRSGLTITTGIACRLTPGMAATFSFLMAIPVIAGGGLLEIVKLAAEPHGATPVSLMVLGGGLSCLVGILSLRLLLSWLDRGRFHWFAWWCIPFGVLSILWHIGLMG